MMPLKVTGVKLSLDDALDIRDALSCNGYPGEPTMCSGGRLCPDGYVCIHCRKDESAGDKCGSPRGLALAEMAREIASGKQVLFAPMAFG